MINNKLNLIKNSLQNLYRKLNSSSSLNDLEIKKAGNKLQKILLTKSFNLREQHELTIFMTKNNMLSLFQRIYKKFETNLEADFARLLISKNRDAKKTLISDYPVYYRYIISLKNEIKLAKIDSKDKVLFVGSGPFPITAILIHELTHSQVYCVEKNRTFAELSQKVINNFGYENSIYILNKDGMNINYSGYSVIVIAILAKSQDKLLGLMWKQVSQGTRIIYRTVDMMRQAFYEKTKENIFKKYHSFEKGNIGDKRTISSTLLVKN